MLHVPPKVKKKQCTLGIVTLLNACDYICPPALLH